MIDGPELTTSTLAVGRFAEAGPSAASAAQHNAAACNTAGSTRAGFTLREELLSDANALKEDLNDPSSVSKETGKAKAGGAKSKGKGRSQIQTRGKGTGKGKSKGKSKSKAAERAARMNEPKTLDTFWGNVMVSKSSQSKQKKKKDAAPKDAHLSKKGKVMVSSRPPLFAVRTRKDHIWFKNCTF